MSVWYCIPSKRSPEEAEQCLAHWRAMGYKIALFLDNNYGYIGPLRCNEWLCGPYPGYANSVNMLAALVLKKHPSCDWIVTGGDDTDPDPTHTADEIAAQCTEHFGGTFGVCQPTGDRWSDSHPTTPRIIERVAGSPWLGREWCLRANQGKGPLWPPFFHMFADETLQGTAEALGVFWQRPDLCHFHNHWGRPKPGEKMGNAENMPAFLHKANSDAEWRKSKAEFERLKAGGFQECFPK